MRKVGLAVALTVKSAMHARSVVWLLNRPRESLIRQYVRERPALRSIALTPFVSAGWNAERRFAAIRNHFETVASLHGAFRMAPTEFVELLNLSGISDGLNVTLDSPHWLIREGLLAVSLWEGHRRIYTLSFTLGREGDELIAFIGGLQGVKLDDAAELYKRLTKAAFGLRPRDLLLDVFRFLCRAIEVDRILAISNASRHHHSNYSRRWLPHDPVIGNYDEIWMDRGGQLGDDGFFEIPLNASRRSSEETSPKKRAMYRNRYAMLDEIAAAMTMTMRREPITKAHPHLGSLSLPDAVAGGKLGLQSE